MKYFIFLIALFAGVALADTFTFTSSGTSAKGQAVSITGTVTIPDPATPPPPPPPPPPPTANCGLTLGGSVVFCDTFDVPKNGGTRSGALDPDVWGVSRATGFNNLGQGQYDAHPATQLVTCSGTVTVNSPNDVIICGGQLREASNDNLDGGFDDGSVTTLAMYPKQPFDFAGRTGTVSFDVSNDTGGSHAAWPEFWVTDLPIPTPFSHFDGWRSLPANGFGIRLSANAEVGDGGVCPNTNNLNKRRWTAPSIVVVRNNIYEDVSPGSVDYGTPSGMQYHILDCVLSSNGTSLNHVEVKVSQSTIDVYATDAGAVTLKHIAQITNAGLTFTRGLVWMEDSHYNADKGPSQIPSQRNHTFIWDNLAFDGPFTYRDFSYDALDAGAPILGKVAQPGGTASWDVLNVPATPSPAAVRVLFNFSLEAAAGTPTLRVIVNGHSHSVPWPYPESLGTAWRTLAVTIPVTDLVAGTNVVQLGADTLSLITANVDIVLVAVPGGIPVLPGSNNTYPH